MRDVLAGLLLFAGIGLFAIFALPLLEFAAYGIALIAVLGGAILVATLLLWCFARWNWDL